MDINISMPLDVARALYETLLTPQKDLNGHTIYPVTITLAGEVRIALADAMAVMK